MTDADRERAAQFCDNARYFLALGNERALQSALYFFDQALAVDPRHARAYAGKARCYAEIGDGGYVTPPLPQLRALDFANRALALERLAEAACVRAKALVELCYAWDDAHAMLDDVDAQPDVSAARALFAIYRGRFDEALALTNAPMLHAIALVYARRAREAMPLLELLEPASTRLWNVPTMLGLAFYLDGKAERAIAVWDDARDAYPASAAYLLNAYASLGRDAEYHALKREIEDDDRGAYHSPFWDALGTVGAGNVDGAVQALERGLAMRDPWMPRLLVEPMLDPLRGTPAFERIATIVRDGTELPPRPGT